MDTTKKFGRDLGSPFGSERESFVSLSDLAKSQEEWERYSVPEDLSDEQRVCYLLTKGSNLQKQSALEIFLRLAKETHGTEVNTILQEIVENSWKYDTEIQMSCAEHVLSALPIMSSPQLYSVFGLTRTMVAVRNEEVISRWSDVLVQLVQHLPMGVCEREVLEFAQSKGGLSEPVLSRIMCARLLGALAKRFGQGSGERAFFFKAMGLCQDTEYPVRAAMCDQLDAVARCVGIESAKKNIVPELSELLKDEEKEVKCAALASLVTSLDFYDSAFRKAHFLPVLKKFVTAPASLTSSGGGSTDEFYRLLVSKIGEILWKISPDLDDEDDVIVFCTFLRDAYARPDPEIKRLCAYNFPGVLKSVGARRYALHLHSTFLSMCEDSSEQVRFCAAAGFHEVALILGKERSVQYLKDPFISLLRDEALSVQDILVEHIDSVLPLFSITNEEQKVATYSQIFTHLLAFEAQARRQWRRLHSLLTRAEHFPCYFSVDQLHEKFVPLLFYYLTNSVFPVKKAAGRLLIEWSRRMRVSVQMEIIQRLSDEFGKAHSCFHRIEFLEMCGCVIEKYSRRFFREKLLESALDLSKDPVANVRMRLCSLLPLIKKTLRPPSEIPTPLLARFNECFSFLLLDRDKDVCEAAKAAQIRIGEIEAEFQRESKLRIESPEDILDKKKIDEEFQSAQMEQEAEKAKRRKEIVDRLRNELKKPSDPPTASGSSGNTLTVPTLTHHSSMSNLTGTHRRGSVSSLLTARPGGTGSGSGKTTLAGSGSGSSSSGGGTTVAASRKPVSSGGVTSSSSTTRTTKAGSARSSSSSAVHRKPTSTAATTTTRSSLPRSRLPT